MNLSDPATLAATRTGRIARLLPGATLIGTLVALPRFAQAATGRGSHVYMVVTAFAVLVAAAIVASIVSACSRRHARAESAQNEYSDSRYRRDPRIRQYPDC